MSELPDRLPRHVAIIMDGNGRWARLRGKPRVHGHSAGVQSVRAVVRACRQWGIDVLTLYAFSTENWRRPRSEVDYLMRQLRRFLKEERAEMVEKGIRLQPIGALEELPPGVRRALRATVRATADCRDMVLALALNYGSRREITDAARFIARRARHGELDPDSLDEETFAEGLYTAGLPDPDLLIRTAGEMRVSNFLLWQISYAEIYVTDTLWPDFGREELAAALREFAARERRYGALGTEADTDKEHRSAAHGSRN
jgi:undecaprenyl diphosphate synthase